jgi:cell fate regulator YaaT (PSP1 superfamily)
MDERIDISQGNLPNGDDAEIKTVRLETAQLSVKIVHSSETELCKPKDGASYAPGDYVVVESRYGKDLGEVLGFVNEFNTNISDTGSNGPNVYEVLRHASDEDLRRFDENRRKEADAYLICKNKISEHNLDMKLVSAHYLLEESKILFFFTADARVDFRELVKDLVTVFKTRIELRQIGVRDESRVVGGIGVCGRAYCCHEITDKLKPVTIKMAKVQNLSLNSMKISGPCGRLLCCLSYEYDTYSEEKKKLPNEGYKISYDDSLFKVVEVNILAGVVKFYSDDGRQLEVPSSRIYFDDKVNKWKIRSLDIQPPG